jgi:formylglycine-generating enzyme required for sulfatase activity
MTQKMRLFLTAIAFAFVACTPDEDKDGRLEAQRKITGSKIENQVKKSISIESLRERSDYATLDKQDVEEVAKLAELHWPKQFADFNFKSVEHFSAGGVAHWMSIWVHSKTDLEFVLLPGGKFQMGSPLTEKDRREDERQNWVSLDPFLISRTECTRKAWIMGAPIAGLVGDQPTKADQLPISGIGPIDVEIWCREAFLTFPTEAQWEYMCRAGTTTAWSSGKERSDLARYANLGSLDCPADWIGMKGITEPWFDGYGIAPAEVGSFACNAFGLFDVHGNLNEWCRDYYFDYNQVKPEKGNGARLGNSGERLARGGNGGGDALAARSAKRLTTGPGISPGGGGNHGFGFRPSVDLPF